MALNIKNGLSPDGKKRIHHEEQTSNKQDQQKSHLPKIKAGSLTSKDDPEEPLKPLKQITVNYKTRDIDFLNFKQKYAVSPRKFEIAINQLKGDSAPRKKKGTDANNGSDLLLA